MDFSKLENQFKIVGVSGEESSEVCWHVPSAIWEIWVGSDTETGSEEMQDETLGLFGGIQLQCA